MFAAHITRDVPAPQTERNLDAAHELVADHAATIGKFRELVQRLQDQNTELRDQLERETNKPVGVPAEKIDFEVRRLAEGFREGRCGLMTRC